MSQGASKLLDQPLTFPSGSAHAQPQQVGKASVAVWASCSKAPDTTVMRTKTVEVDSAVPPPSCEGGAPIAYYAFCLSSPNQTMPPECYLQFTTIVASCSEAAAESQAQAAAANWSLTPGECPSNCQ